jgi:hypothetical protein
MSHVSGSRWIPRSVALVAMIAMPAYLGSAHASYVALVGFSLVAAAAMVLGEMLDQRCSFRSTSDAVGQVLIYAGLGMIAGSIAHLFTLQTS